MIPERGDRVRIPSCMHISVHGTAVAVKYDPHLPWPQILVLHDGPGAPHPRQGPYETGRRRRLWWWADHSVLAADRGI